MSSDSDSDICDFTSDVSKKMSKGFNQFWQNYKQKENAECSKTTLGDTVEDSVEMKENIINMKDDSVKNDGIINFDDTRLMKDDNVKNNGSMNLDDTSEVVETNEDNIQNRITNKLDQLVEEINTIVQNKQKRKPRKLLTNVWGSKRTRNLRKRKLNKPNIKTVVLSSDEESKPSISFRQNINNVQPNDEVNPIVTVNVLWKSVDKNTFKIPKYHSLNCISKYYADKFNVNPKLLFFTLDEKQINLDDSSYVSLRLDDTKIVEGGILPESYLEEVEQSANTSVNQDSINFKVQYSDRRNNEINVCCKKDDKMEIVFWKVATSVKQPVEKIKLFFDGDPILPNSKITDLDLEDGDCIDLEICN